MAKLNHTTTPAVRAAAKKGLQAIKDGKVKASDVNEVALAGAKKIASGHKLSDAHVRSMATYHDAHAANCPSAGRSEVGVESAEDLMWGGPAGAMWANQRCAAMDTTALADDELDLDKLLGDGTDLSFEIFGHAQGEKMHLDEDDDGLVWAPILRSGTLAMRPGPGGQKIAEPLVFVPGRSADPRKEIGLEDLLDAFNEEAVQHVTIPTTHENDVLSNTGFIEGMKIVDSTMRPGEMVLMGAHRFTEPDAREKVERGTVANRSCGILYDFTNTETGTTFPAVVEHVCLTNRPWVPGMEPYGMEDDDDATTNFSKRTVVPMLLSETPKLNLANKSKGSVSEDEWDGSSGRFTDAQYKRSCLIDRGGSAPVKERCSLPVREPGGALNRKAVHAAASMISKLKGVSADEKKSAAKKIVSLYNGPLKETAPPALVKLAAVKTNMSDEDLRKELLLTDVAWDANNSLQSIRSQLVEQLRDMHQGPEDEPSRIYFYVMDVTPDKALVGCDYDFDDDTDDAWVVPFTLDDQGKVQLADFSAWSPVTQEWVVDDDAKQQSDELNGLIAQDPKSASQEPPSLGLADLPAGSLERASAERLALSREQPSPPTTGGQAMSLTREQILGLNLDDAQKQLLLADHEERQRERAELLTRRTSDRNNEVKTYLTDLADKAQKAKTGLITPGFLKEVERALLADDGKVAAVLNLSDAGGTAEQNVTITEVVKRLVGSLPLAEGSKADPTQLPSLLESPIEGRPPAEPEKTDPDQPKTGQALADLWKQQLGGNLDLALTPEPAAAAPAGKE